MPIDTSLLQPVPQPAPFNFAQLQQSIDAGRARDTNLTAGGLAAGGDFQGASAAALKSGNPQLAGQVFDLGNSEHAAAAKAGVQAMMQANTPAAWNQARAHVLQTTGTDSLGPFEKRDAIIKAATDALDPAAAASRNLQASQFEQTLNKPVVVPYGSTLQSPATGQRVGGQPQAADTGDVLSGIDPQIANMVKGVANYSLDLSSLPRSGPVRQQVLSLVQQYDPTFSAANYGARASTIKSFASGPDAQNIASLNTAVGHLGTLWDTIPSLNNVDWPVGASIVNGVKNAVNKTGSQGAALGQFEYAANAVSNELGKVFKGSGAVAEGEMRDWQKQLSSASTPTQMRAVIQQGVELVNSRLEALNSKYENTMGRPYTSPIINQKAQGVLDRINAPGGEGPAASGASNAAPPGGTQIQAGSQGNPIQVATPEDAMRLPVGTVFTTPDGRTKIR